MFVFEGVAGEWIVRQTWKIENEEAARILARREWNWEDGRPARPIVSLSHEGSISRLAVPINFDGAAGVYFERAIDSNRGHFNRRDLNFVVALVRDWDLGARKVEKSSSDHFGRIITKNPKMIEILETLEKLQGMHLTILLQGETGTGKGLFASEISKGNPGPLVTINCADLSESVLESELFGHVKSAFTGATTGKKGLFETADGGTVFIDEIDKTSRKFQEKLLRVVDRQEFKPVGSVRVKRVDCRIVCASNRNLGEAVKAGEFLADLYYRLKVISILIPPLRERPEDILLLADHFLRRFADQFEKPGIRLSEESLALLAKHTWPGNVRDLQNEMERAVALSAPEERIDPEDFSEELLARDTEAPGRMEVGERTLAEMVGSLEKRIIDQVLRECVGNKSKASRVLGLTRKGLRNKIQRYGIQEP
ncbi:MAG: sigma-54-dependent Fis family transcriptional regulator [Gemmatimonadetes bacterium]|nr:sigma-54-dependent Fis family transcriptional regulator [Gemmatimonadota bacterium]